MSTPADRRTCRACGESFEYPGHQSLATRTHCEHCVQLPEPVRRAFERLRRRVDRLAREVQKLKASATGPST
jgi:hypothetical protein